MKEKYRAIEALDEALDVEIVKAAKTFASSPSQATLKLLADLVTVDCYCDEFLEDYNEDGTKMEG